MSGRYIVVGGLSGIGRSVVNQLCTDKSSSILATTRCASNAHELPPNLIIKSLDLSSNKSVSIFIDEAINEFPSIDGLVLCAGFIHTAPALMTTEEMAYEHLQINFLAQLNILQYIVRKRMLRNRQGSVVYVSSSAEKFANPGRLAYAASKAAMSTAIRVMSRELGSKGIRFNSVLPGLTDTALMRGSTLPADIAGYLQNIDNRRVASPSDVASLITFLLSDSSSHITGQCISIDGGI